MIPPPILVVFDEPSTLSSIVIKGLESLEVTVAGLQLRCKSSRSKLKLDFCFRNREWVSSKGVNAIRPANNDPNSNLFPIGYNLNAFNEPRTTLQLTRTLRD